MQSLILYLLIFSLPFQVRLLLVQGGDEYQSLFLYATDILIGFLFLFWVFNTSHFSSQKHLFLPALLFAGWFLVSSFFSQDTLVGIYQTIKIAEFLWLFFYIRSLAQPIYARVLQVFVASATFQSIIAIGQFIRQQDFGLRILGENVLAPDIAGVAKLDVFGEKIIRAYGTFPHPNVLAGFLVVALFVLFLVFLQKRKNEKVRKLLFLISPLLIVGLLVTFSRVALLTAVLLMVALWVLYERKDDLKVFASIIALSFTVFGLMMLPLFQSRLSFNFADQSVSLRVFYVKTAFTIFSQHPLVGVGPGQFTAFQQDLVRQARLEQFTNQPVHNMYLLLIAETGLVGLFFLYWFLQNLFYPMWNKEDWRRLSIYFSLATAVFILASFDHYFLTFQQGGLLFWTSLAISTVPLNIKV